MLKHQNMGGERESAQLKLYLTRHRLKVSDAILKFGSEQRVVRIKYTERVNNTVERSYADREKYLNYMAR